MGIGIVDLISTLLAAIVGGAIAGWFSLRAVQETFKNQQKQADDNEDKFIKGLLQSIHDEIETVYERYQEAMGAKLESLNKDQPLQYYYPLVSDFFTVYNSNGLFIGRIPDNDLRKQIIKTYTLAKGIVDSYRMNNELVSKWEFAEKIFAESQSDVHRQHAIAHFQTLVLYADTLKEAHKQLKYEVFTLLRDLRKQGVLNEKIPK